MSNIIINFILGITLALISTVMFNAAVVFQKMGLSDMEEISLSDGKSFVNLLHSKIWIVGMVLGITGGIPYMISQDLIGVAIAQPLQGAGILVLTFFAVRYLGEKLKTPEKIGVICLFTAPILISFGQVSDVQVSVFNPAIIPPLIIFYSVFLSLIAITFILYKFSKKGIPLIVATTAGLFFGIGAISSQLGVEGFLGPFFRGTAINWGLGLFGILFVIIGNLFATMYVQIAYQRGQAVQVVPIINVGNLLIPIFGGVLIFGQVIGNLFFFVGGVAVMFAGVVLLSRIQGELQKEEEPSKEKTDEGEE